MIQDQLVPKTQSHRGLFRYVLTGTCTPKCAIMHSVTAEKYAGARLLGIDALVGSLKPGKRADVIMVSTEHLNMCVFTDPAHVLVESAQPENVDTVIVDGRILKRNGKLTALSTNATLREAAASLDSIRKLGAH